MKTYFVFLSTLFQFSLCRDFYAGMFKKNDVLVAQDTVYKESNPFGFTTANYGRVFHCPITYFRVSDRLGIGRPPSVTVTRGGIQKKYITLRLTSSYNTPIAVNIYVGCENKVPPKTTPKPLQGDENENEAHDGDSQAEDEGEGHENDDEGGDIEEADSVDTTPADAAATAE